MDYKDDYEHTQDYSKTEEEFYVQVVETEDSTDIIELPTEKDGSILMSTIQAQFPGATGLKYKSPSGNAWRGVRVAENKLDPPSGGWQDQLYVVTILKTDSVKRKLDESPNRGASEAKLVKTAGSGERGKDDLIVLGLSWKASEDDLRSYFEKFGTISTCEIKRDPQSGRSRGFAFVGFTEDAAKKAVLKQPHTIFGRKVEVTYPRKEQVPTKIFVGRLPAATTEDDLREHFETFGEITDVYLPKPMRGFAFVTFVDQMDSKKCVGSEHYLKESRLNVTYAEPKGEKVQQRRAEDQPRPREDVYRGSAARGSSAFDSSYRGAGASYDSQEKPFDFEDMMKIFSNAQKMQNFAALMATNQASVPASVPFQGNQSHVMVHGKRSDDAYDSKYMKRESSPYTHTR